MSYLASMEDEFKKNMTQVHKHCCCLLHSLKNTSRSYQPLFRLTSGSHMNYLYLSLPHMQPPISDCTKATIRAEVHDALC